VQGSPEIVVVSNVTEDGRPIGVPRAGENWHSNMYYAARPPRGTMLYALEIPELFGLALGDTEFASTAAAWDALPERMQRHLDGRRAVFDFAGRKRAFPPTQAEIDRYPPVTHPIVRTHPVTGRRISVTAASARLGRGTSSGRRCNSISAACAASRSRRSSSLFWGNVEAGIALMTVPRTRGHRKVRPAATHAGHGSC
jgi:Taurine catabolism dioxygenase TauD, TfdA family